MPTQLPAEIAEAIEVLVDAVAYDTDDGFAIESERSQNARAALDAVILKHLGSRTRLADSAPSMLGALQCVVAAMDDMGLQQLDRSDSCPVLKDALSDLVSAAEGRPRLRAVQ